MPRVVLTAEVEDTRRWEEKFRTRAELFRRLTLTQVRYTIGEGNRVAISVEVSDLDRYLEGQQDDSTRRAMVEDGVKPETVELYVLDREVHF